MSDQEDIALGEFATTLTTNPAYQAAITRMKARVFDQWTSTGRWQRKDRIELWRFNRVITDFENELELMIRDANIVKTNHPK